jgi:HEAT repeat protein
MFTANPDRNRLSQLITGILFVALAVTGCQRGTRVDRLIDNLRSDDELIRDQAISSLAEIGMPAIKPLVDALADPRLRKNAGSALTIIGKPAVGAVVGAVQDEDAEVRQEAANVLGKIGDPASVPVLVELLKDTDAPVRGMAAGALARIGEPSVDPLVASLNDPAVQPLAVAALTRIGVPAVDPIIGILNREKLLPSLAAILKDIGEPAVNPLLAAMKHENAAIRNGAAYALGITGDPRAVDTLLAARSDSNAQVRQTSAEALAGIGSPAIAPIINALSDKKTEDIAVYALVEIGKPAVRPLIEALDSDDPHVRSVAIGILGEIGDSEAVVPITGLLDDPDQSVRLGAASALGRFGDDRAVMSLVSLLKDESTAAEAADSLAKIGMPAVLLLIDLLSDKAGHVRKHASSALGRIGDARAVEPLISLINDEDPEVRLHAVTALGQLKDERACKPLVSLLKDEPETRIKELTILTLADIADPYAVKQLTVVARDTGEQNNLRAAAVTALGRITDKRATESLILLAARERDIEHRKLILNTIAEVRGADNVGPLILAIKKEGPEIQAAARKAFGNIRDADAVPALIEALTDKDRQIKDMAADSLVQIGLPAVKMLITSTSDQDIGGTAADALAKIGEPAVESLILALDDATVARHMIQVLVKIGTPAVDPLLVALKHEKAAVRSGAAESLVRIKDRRAVKPLVNALKEEDLAVIAGAHAFFLPVCNTNIEPLLIQALYNHGTPDMAMMYVNSGIKKLVTAGRGWARRNNFEMVTD